MGKKYIIELEDKPFHNGNGDFLYRVKGFNSLVFDMTGVGKLTRYTEPDLEQVRKEAYEDGYKTAKIQCGIQAEKDMREVGKRHYQRGLSDAWDAARKIANMPYGEEEKVFGSGGWTFIEKHTASEAIEKIRQYEQEKKEYHVGDEAIQHIKSDGLNPAYDEKVIILSDTGADSHYVMYSDGLTAEVEDEDLVKKTGRHFPEIAEVLRKMMED